MSDKNTTIQDVRNALQLDNESIAQLLGFKDARSYGNSPKRVKYEQCIIAIYNRTKALQNEHN